MRNKNEFSLLVDPEGRRYRLVPESDLECILESSLALRVEASTVLVDDVEPFGKKLARLRAVKNLTQDRLASAAKVTQTQISRIESLDVSPRESTKIKLMQALDLVFYGSEQED